MYVHYYFHKLFEQKREVSVKRSAILPLECANIIKSINPFKLFLPMQIEKIKIKNKKNSPYNPPSYTQFLIKNM